MTRLSPRRLERSAAGRTAGVMSAAEWRNRLPYGMWKCGDGREVVFNRGYVPILERYPDEPAIAANPNEWIDWIEQHFYWDDYADPRRNAETLERINELLLDWGMPALPPPPPPNSEC
jgi:hypothetical protein